MSDSVVSVSPASARRFRDGDDRPHRGATLKERGVMVEPRTTLRCSAHDKIEIRVCRI
jgi:hypothetical protein